MPKRSSKKTMSYDINQAAVDDGDGKNPAAVALGRLGGLKGGKARAKSLTKEERSKIAKKAARVRWAGVKRKGH